MKTTEKMRVMIGKEIGCYGAKIRETISGSACVLDRRIFFEEFQKKIINKIKNYKIM
jgi:hypothetical protein